MDGWIGEVGLHTGPLWVVHRQRLPRTTGKAADKSGSPSTDGSMALSRKWVAERLTADGFFGFNISQCESLRLFAQAEAGSESGSKDASSVVDCVRDALREHGYYCPTSSGTEKIAVFLEPTEQPTSEPAAEIDSSTFLETAQEIAAQTAGQIQAQPDLASEAQARVFGGVAVKLLF